MFPGWLFDPGNEEYKRITIVAYPTAFIAVVALIIIGSLRLIHHNYFSGFSDLTMAAVLAGIILYHRKTKKHHHYVPAVLGVTAYGIFCMYLFFFNEHGGPTFLWSYTFPLMVFPLLGSRRGIGAVILFLIPIFLLLVLDLSLSFMTPYPRDFTFSFIPSILSVSVLSYLYERNRERNQQQMNMSNSALQRSKEEMEQQVQKRTADLARSEKNYRFLTERMSDIVWTVDLNLNINYVSPSVTRTLGFTPEEYLSFPFHERVTPEAFKNSMAIFASEIENEKIPATDPARNHKMEAEFCHKNGSTVWMESIMNAIRDDGGNLVGIHGVSRDITYRRQAEEEQAKIEALNRQLQKAESLGRMAGAVAHHFNNKLGVVMGNLEMAMDKLPQGTEPIENLTAAMQAAGKAAEVSSLMLTYLGQAPGKREPLDISEACLPFLPILRAAMPGKVVLETDLPSPGPVISANTNQIQQVLTNLITNAWEAVGEGRGVIRLSIKTVSPAEITAANRFPIGWQSKDSAYTCLEVTDTGCGIADKDIENLFDPFFSSKFTGRGLGLPVILGIVRAHGGVITVESEPGIGSAFRVFFPVSVEEVPWQPYREAQAPEMEGGGTVLLVEDEEMVRTMGKRMLMRLGFTVLEAKDGVEAVEVFRQHQDEIGCVLCDLTMPRINGWETLAALRKLKPGVPVILTSGYDKAHVMAGDHPEWPQVFLGKPYKLKELSDAISQALISRH